MNLVQFGLHISIAIVVTQLNGFNHWCLALIILFTINHLFANSEVVTYAIYHYSAQHYTFVCTQLNGTKYSYVSLTIQLNTSHLFRPS